MDAQRGPSGCIIILLALVAGLAGGVGGTYLAINRMNVDPGSPAVTQPVTAPVTGRIEVQTERDAIVNAVERVGGAVVKIVATREPENIWEHLYGTTQAAIGSGFVFDYQGQPLILTNSHVVRDAHQLLIKLTDGRQLPGSVIGREDSSDIAVVSFDQPPADLVAAPLGDSDTLRVGEWVVAIGNPFDYEHTVTVGVVSAKGYRPVGRNRYQNVIQTDAAINTGNSGGPLIDLGGNVVGINYSIFSPTGATVGIGFAIPINSAKQMLYFLTEGGPWIGLGEVVPNSVGLSSYLGLATAEGVIVVEPMPGGPADRAGLRPRDVIIAIGGKRIRGPDQMRDELLKHRIGDTIVLDIQRGEQQIRVEVPAGRHPAAR